MQNIPIVSYHKVSDKREVGLTTVSSVQFRGHMQWLQQNDYQSILFKDIIAGRTLPEKPVIITFDDGYESVYNNAVPIMRETGFTGIIYIITKYIGKYNTWEAVPFQRTFRHISVSQILELQEDGFEFGVHGRNHFYLPVLPSRTLRDEIFEAKNDLEAIVNREVYSFCYPYGRLSHRVCNYVSEAGYTFALRNLSLFNNHHRDPFGLQRRSIYGSDTLNDFINKIKFPLDKTTGFLKEWIIQKGALASIAVNIFNGSHFKN